MRLGTSVGSRADSAGTDAIRLVEDSTRGALEEPDRAVPKAGDGTGAPNSELEEPDADGGTGAPNSELEEPDADGGTGAPNSELEEPDADGGSGAPNGELEELDGADQNADITPNESKLEVAAVVPEVANNVVVLEPPSSSALEAMTELDPLLFSFL